MRRNPSLRRMKKEIENKRQQAMFENAAEIWKQIREKLEEDREKEEDNVRKEWEILRAESNPSDTGEREESRERRYPDTGELLVKRKYPDTGED